jgi:Uma2 family endonuclease
MAAVTQVPLETYLHTAYRPDCEYLDGELKQRNVGEKEHARLQMTLSWILRNHEVDWGISVYPELRVQVSPTRFRVPDITVLRADAPDEQIITHPPLIVIEILSPSDTLLAMRERIEDYLAFAIPHVWIIDPTDRMGYVCHSGVFREWQPSAQLAVPGTPILLDLAQLPK